jgi:hypothetical protein
MRKVDNELKNALRRKEPPAGFAERVLERVDASRLPSTSLRPGKPDPTYDYQAHDAQTYRPRTWDPPLGGLTRHMSFVRWAAAAAVVVALAGEGLQYRALQRERAEGEAAKARVMLALHIASSKLQLVQTKINRMHEQPEKNSNQ